MRYNPIRTTIIILILSMPLFRASAAEWESFYPIRGFEDVALRDGELWCGTGSGLFILDTDDFSYRRVTSMEGYPGREITEIAWEDDDTLLVATERRGDVVGLGNGLYRYYPDTGEWSPIVNTFPSTNPNYFTEYYAPYTTNMAVDGDGRTWLSGDGGLHFIRGDSLITVMSHANWEDSLRVSCIASGSDGELWVGCNLSGTGNSSSRLARWNEGELIVEAEYPAAAINNLTVAPDGVVWFTIGLTDSVFSYDGTELTGYHAEMDYTDYEERMAATSGNDIWFTDYRKLVRIRDGEMENMATGFMDGLEALDFPHTFLGFKHVFSDDNTIWIVARCKASLEFQRLYFDIFGKYAEGQWRFFIPAQELIYPYHSGGVSKVSVDADGTVWLWGGVDWFPWSGYSFDGESWRDYNFGFVSYPVDLFMDTRNRPWFIGTNGIGYVEHNELTLFMGRDNPLFLDQFVQGTSTQSAVWTADASGNVYRYEYGGEWIRFDAADVGVPGAKCIAADGSGCIWVAGDHAIGWFDGSEWTVDTGFPTNLVRDVAVDEQGIAWFATYTGLYSFDVGLWNTYTTENSGLSSDDINHVLAARNGSLWISSYGGGLCKFDGESWEIFTSGNAPLPSNYIHDIAEAPDGSIWIAANGLAHYIPDTQTWVETDTSVARPSAIAITGVWPNPFNSVVTIGYELTEAMPITFEVYSITGQRIYYRDLGRILAGIHQVTWDGVTGDGRNAAGGLYLLRIGCGANRVTTKAIFLK